ncbi:aminoglycoside N(3)-acetyltransferase [Priestia endophytica]|uniref:aminoglycoside N(3)-acetyltransferase n=1 Tax=Priestia endophytica TaxID=135735 RepID=UPI00124D5A25|nr:AAC(3) family N-acetyltransferase [Priestia endophytica]KAB2488380.1 AAC(3) family N-acetyltransferase [Priestia endophytica]
MKKIVESTEAPRTKKSIKEQLQDLGLKPGMKVLVHSSLSSLGWVNGGAVTVIEALMEVITEQGTIVMPSQSVDLSNPSKWENPPVPESWWSTIKDTMPAYHPSYTPTTGMGKIVEVFRTYPNVIRSNHPSCSFVTWGKDKELILEKSDFDFPFGEGSPLDKLYQQDSYVLLLGVGFDSNTCFHLAEYRIPYRKEIIEGAPIMKDNERIWKEYRTLEYREELFEEMGEDYEQTGKITVGKVGSATSKLFSLQSAVNFAELWLSNR